ncbi:MAG: hypothetical protein ACPL4H_09290 [Anaerolineales bacterium]
MIGKAVSSHLSFINFLLFIFCPDFRSSEATGTVIASVAKQSPTQHRDCFGRWPSFEKAVSDQLSAISFLLSVLRFPFFDYNNRSEETVSTHPILSEADVIASAAKQSPIQHGDCFSRNERSFAMTLI